MSVVVDSVLVGSVEVPDIVVVSMALVAAAPSFPAAPATSLLYAYY
jgi:hypothetical protein